jgi:hypothetical protein
LATCQDLPPCGDVGQSCCAANSCNDPFECVDGTCRDTRCGAVGEACCTGAKKCLDTLSCEVGQCVPSCDPFAQDCPAREGCVASADTGEAGCVALSYTGKDGAPCVTPEECHAGFYCVAPPMMQGACRAYCGGPNNVTCTNGHTCIDLSTKVPQTIVGVCAG